MALNDVSGDGHIVVGFDFPIGVPAAYADLVAIHDFRSEIIQFGAGRWSDFFTVAAFAEQISLLRPFYPAVASVKGQVSRRHLHEGLGLDRQALLRGCHRAAGVRGDAEVLFWTLGGKQVGKGAIHGWREVLQPALRDPTLDVALWPFEGRFYDLIAERRITIAETYPAEFYSHIGVRFVRQPGLPAPGKRNRADRQLNSTQPRLSSGPRTPESTSAQICDPTSTTASATERTGRTASMPQ
jgi:hypothetical protein